MARMRSCLVRGITDSADEESYIQAERHDCQDCSPDAWVMMNLVSHTYGVDDACVHLRTTEARKLGLAMVCMADQIDARE